MSILTDLLRHAAARAALRRPDATVAEREQARRTLGLADQSGNSKADDRG